MKLMIREAGQVVIHSDDELAPPGQPCIGDRVPPVSAKLAKRMGKLLEEEGSSKDDRPHRSHKVTDIFTWLQCFSSYVCGSAGCAHSRELMAYLRI